MNSHITVHPPSTFPLSKYIWLISAAWIFTLTVSCFVNIHHAQDNVIQHSVDEATAYLHKDTIYRHWVASHGGVYVPVTENTSPNPYLSHVKERDIITPSGRKLTLVSPAYMTREINELEATHYKGEGQGHITSLKPIKAENSADIWETKALQAFEQGETQKQVIIEIDGQQYLRLMQPLITEKHCLHCHARQGYKEGDIRGGISVSVLMEPHYAIAKKAISSLIIWHILILFVGFIGIGLGAFQVQKRLRESILAKQSLVISEAKLRQLFENGNDALFVYHPTLDGLPGNFVDVNEKACQLTSYTREELLSMSPKDLTPLEGKEKIEAIVRKRLENGGRIVFELSIITKNGQRKEVEISDTLFEVSGKPIVLSIVRDQTDRKKIELEKEEMIKELKMALDEVEILRGIIPICTNCKKIRNDEGYWQQVDHYITEHTDVEFSHGICKECSDELYGGLDWYEKNKDKFFKKKE